MEVVRVLEPHRTNRPFVLTMGKFDGLHLGHHELISTTVERAHTLGFGSAVLTWDPHPNAVIHPGQPLQLLTSLEEKIELIARFNPDRLFIIPFTYETLIASADAYLRQILTAVRIRELWVGEGFAMGRARTGDIPTLMYLGAGLGFAVGALTRVVVGGAPVSASRVRALLEVGDVAAATALLNRPFGLRGLVVKGHQRGRTLGFPTANLRIDPNHILPADGVYACRAFIGSAALPAVTNIGLRPTFDGLDRAVEVHVLDWSGDLYGQTLRIEFLHRLRGEQKFANVAALVAQIQHDAATARDRLRP